MDKVCFLAMTFAIILALLIVLIVVLKNGKFSFSFKRGKKKDVLQVEAEHHTTDIDK